MAQLGTVYLLHFERHLRSKAQHYMGWTGDLVRRVKEHRSGAGAVFTRHMARAGVGFEVVRTWEGVSRAYEWRLKSGGTARWRLCPICNPGEWHRALALVPSGQVQACAAHAGADPDPEQVP